MSTDSYEKKAEMFRKRTGMLAPGKDESAAYGSGATQLERQMKWKDFLNSPCVNCGVPIGAHNEPKVCGCCFRNPCTCGFSTEMPCQDLK